MIDALANTVAEQARALGVPPPTADQLGRAVAERVRHRYGGCEVYVQLTNRVQRDAGVLAAFNGRNRDRVCQRFGISRATFYRILREQGQRPANPRPTGHPAKPVYTQL